MHLNLPIEAVSDLAGTDQVLLCLRRAKVQVEDLDEVCKPLELIKQFPGAASGVPLAVEDREMFVDLFERNPAGAIVGGGVYKGDKIAPELGIYGRLA